MISQWENSLISLTVLFYLLSMILYFAIFSGWRNKASRAALSFLTIAFIVHMAALLVRTVAAGRLPFSNMYEFTSLFAWGIVLVFIFIEKRYSIPILGIFVLPLILSLMGYALILPKDIKPLTAALQSYWLQIHVFCAVLAYGGLGVSFGSSVAYLIRKRGETKGRYSSGLNRFLPGLRVLGEITDGAISFAFPLLTLVLITGAIWAERVWGTYWSWDPKETWALITWIIYAVYLHARFTRGWEGVRAAWMSIIGFLAVLFTFFGVNLLLSGLHSYV